MPVQPLQILTDPRFRRMRGVLEENSVAAAASIAADADAALLDGVARRVLQDCFRNSHADEGTVWLADATTEYLVPIFNTGLNARKLIGKFEQPLSEGLISMVFATELPFAENQIYKDPKHSKLLDSRLKLRTYAMIAVPLYFLHGCRGVISCVQLVSPTSKRINRKGFENTDVEQVHHASRVVGRLIDYRVISKILGWTPG